MKTSDLVKTAIGNTFQSRARTILTILAIFVGAFTLTVTSGIGTGVNRYINDTVTSFGANDIMTVTKKTADTVSDDEPREYDPDAVAAEGGDGPASTVVALRQADLDALADIDGVLKVKPAKAVSVDFVQYKDGTRYAVGVQTLFPGQTVQLAQGKAPDNDASKYQVALPRSYVVPLGFTNLESAVGATVRIAVTDAARKQSSVDAIVVGVVEESLNPAGSSAVVANQALTDRLYAVQSVGLPTAEQNRWAQANVTFTKNATPDQITALKDRLADAGYVGTTLADRLGLFTTVVDTIVLVLNGFAIIALVAAGFGIVNTLLMSVQERTREIGLMKALGMRSSRVFALFSLEAGFIGLLGSVLGVVVAVIAGTIASQMLAGAVLSDLPGLSVISFDPATILGTILLIVAVAFVAGTIPAARAARKNPVDALRYE